MTRRKDSTSAARLRFRSPHCPDIIEALRRETPALLEAALSLSQSLREIGDGRGLGDSGCYKIECGCGTHPAREAPGCCPSSEPSSLLSLAPMP